MTHNPYRDALVEIVEACDDGFTHLYGDSWHCDKGARIGRSLTAARKLLREEPFRAAMADFDAVLARFKDNKATTEELIAANGRVSVALAEVLK